MFAVGSYVIHRSRRSEPETEREIVRHAEQSTGRFTRSPTRLRHRAVSRSNVTTKFVYFRDTLSNIRRLTWIYDTRNFGEKYLIFLIKKFVISILQLV